MAASAEASVSFAPIVVSAVGVDVLSQFASPTSCRAIRLARRCSGSCLASCWQAFRPRPPPSRCACPLSWRPFIIFCIGCGSDWMPCALSCAASKNHPPVHSLIRSCKPPSISRLSFPRASVPSARFNSSFNSRFWGEVLRHAH